MTLLRRLLGWMRPYRGRIGMALGAMAAVAGLTVVTLNLIRPLMDEGLFARPQTDAERQAVYAMVARLAGLGLMATLAKGLCKYLADYLVGWVGQKVVFDLRLAVFSRLQRLSLRFFHDRKTGELMSRVMTDIGAMQQMLTQLFGPALSSVISILGLSGYFRTKASNSLAAWA